MRQELQILYEDPDIIVCFKPHGLATQSRRIGTPDLEHMILNHLAEAEHRFTSSHKHRSAPYLAVIHRLDQPVSGILVFAKNPKAARNLNHQLTKEGFGKHYMALVNGCPSKETDTLVDYLVKDSKSNTSRVCDHHTHGTKEARLSYRIHSRDFVDSHSTNPDESKDQSTPKEQTLLEVTLDTGRHHQIRVQLAHMGCPIVGDTKYNPNAQKKGWQEIKLCAYRLAFRHPITGTPLEFQVPFS